ncbi:MAG TPA: Nif3-like dinuclear metal center hexameric protein [bacterium]|nr:Nif3-like dinuclear metal center hexameric protein [bacterium]
MREVLDVIDTAFPPALAEEWDNSGLQLGDPTASVRRIGLALDPTLDAVRQVKAKDDSLLICHHPLFFRPPKQLDFSTPSGKIVREAVAGRVAIAAAHTNADWGVGGTNDMLAELLGLRDVQPFEPLYPHEFRKLTVFVPASHVEAVSEAIFAAGGGLIGDYAKCSYRLEGHGTYLPLAGADPYAGKVGALSIEPEVRMEVRVPVARIDGVLRAMKAAHPYEEVAFDLYPTLRQQPEGGRGRIGRLPRPSALGAFAKKAARIVKAGAPRRIGEAGQTIENVVVVTGGGASFIDRMIGRKNAVLVTGDVGYHDACRARDHGVAVVDLGHYATELPFVNAMKTLLDRELSALGKAVPVTVCRPAGDPLQTA